MYVSRDYAYFSSITYSSGYNAWMNSFRHVEQADYQFRKPQVLVGRTSHDLIMRVHCRVQLAYEF